MERNDEDATQSEDNGSPDEFELRPSTMPDIGVDLNGFASEEVARCVGEQINGYLHVLGKILNLKRLHKVIVSFNYCETLAGLDQGAAVSRPLTPTNDEVAVGIAMAPTILHEGEPRSVLVLNAEYMMAFAPNDSPEIENWRNEMVYTLAHECAHVHDLDMRATALPGTILKMQLSFRDNILFGVASGCWEEYIACRLSALVGTPATLRAYEDSFCAVLERAKGRADAAIRLYRMHSDVGRVTGEVADEYKRVMVYASYLLGHIDGIDGASEEQAAKVLNAMDLHPYFKPFFSALHTELRMMHSAYGNWKSMDVYEPLKQLAHGLLVVGGIDIQAGSDGGAHVAIPFRPETIPTFEEQAAFIASQQASAQK